MSTTPPEAGQPGATWSCTLCGFVYDECAGQPADNIPPGTPWEQVPQDWTCPDCSGSKADFEPVDL